MAQIINNNEVSLDPTSIFVDAFGRFKVSNPIVQLTMTQDRVSVVDNLTYGLVSGSNPTLVYDPNSASTNIGVGTDLCKYRLRSRIRGVYRPGKALMCLITFNMNTPEINVVKNVGYFDDKDGVILRQNGTNGMELVLRSNVTGSVVETVVPQSNWDDPLDGTGDSGLTIDFTKSHVFIISLAWLGVGGISVGFLNNNTPVFVYHFKHFNQLTRTYMGTANLFPAYEIEKTVAGGNSSALTTICYTVLTEGGVIDKYGISYSISRNTFSSFDTGSAHFIRPILLFQLDPADRGAKVIPVKAGIHINTNADFYLYLFRAPSFNTSYTPTWTSISNRSIQYEEVTDNTLWVTNRDIAIVWMAIGNTTLDFADAVFTELDSLGVQYDDTPDIWALAVQCSTPNENVALAFVNFIEQV